MNEYPSQCPVCCTSWPENLHLVIDATVAVGESREGYCTLHDDSHLACGACEWTGKIDGHDTPAAASAWAKDTLAGPIELHWG